MVYHLGGRRHGIALPPLTLDDRRLIFRLLEAKQSIPAIAARLGRHRVTIHREIRRNWYDDAEAPRMSGYFPTVAHGWARDRRQRLGNLHRDVVWPPMCKRILPAAVVRETLKILDSCGACGYRMTLREHGSNKSVFWEAA